MKQFIFFLLISTITLQNGNAQRYNFMHFGEKEGLQNNIIFCLLKDRHGYLWIGTQNGLNRFDGFHFTNFKKTRDGNSLQNNSVHALCEDKEGNIWGGTDNGIFRYSPAQNIFISYHAPKEAISNTITNIVCDEQGNIYTAGLIDVMRFNKDKNAFEILVSVTHSKDSAGMYGFGKNRLLKDEASNGLWIASHQGILFYDLKQQKLCNAENSPGIPLFSNRSVSTISRSSNGNLWFFDNTAKKITLFNPKLKQEIKSINVKDISTGYRVSTILEDSKGKLWLSSWTNELFTIDINNNNKIERVELSKNKEPDVFFWAAREDENGSIWLGTLNGISICSPGKYIYKSCQLLDKIPELRKTVINAIEVSPYDKSWWLLTGSRQLVQYNPATEKYRLFNFDNTSFYISQIGFLGGMPVLATEKGLWCLQPNARKFTPFSIFSGQYADFHVIKFIETDSTIFFTDGKKLLEWRIKSKTGNGIDVQQSGTAAQNGFGIQTLFWKTGQALSWAYNNDYVGVLNKTGSSRLIKITNDTAADVKSYFHDADMDSEGNIWVNNKGAGLYRYNPNTQQVKYWTEFDGMADNHFHSIKADDKGNIWMLYFNKASVFNVRKNSFINFSIPFSENFFTYFNCIAKREDGVVMGSIANEVFEFYADNLNLTPANKTPHLSAINVSGKDYLVTNERQLTVNPDQNSLAFKFGFMPDAGVFPRQFEYKLDGVDNNWVKAATSNEAVYNNLAPGRYTFHLVVKGSNGDWQSDEVVFTIIIRTPFYKTRWFIIAVALLISGLLFFIYRYRLAQKEKMMSLENKAQALEKEKAMVMYENLRQQLNPHFLFNSLTSLNSLIIAEPKEASEFLDSLSKTYRYILKSRDNETVPLIDEIRFAENYVKLQQTRFEKGFEVNINIPEEYNHRKIVPVTLQNLIENAIKHNIIDEDSPLVVRIFIDDDCLVVENNLQKKKFVETSNKQGLANMQSLYNYLSSRPVEIIETAKAFKVKTPLL